MWGHILKFTCLSAIIGSGAMADQSGFVDRFKQIDNNWHVAEYDFEHSMFDTDWRHAQVTTGITEDKQGLLLDLAPHDEGLNHFAGASIRRDQISHYGRYETRLKAAAGSGVVTGFFTYTGPHYGTRHDEIDIEFLGRNTQQLHAAWFVDGVLENHFIDLGFDAATETADYAFEWYPDRLKWFANGKLIFEHHAREGAIPTLPGRLFVNLWAADPSISVWAGNTVQDTNVQAQVEYVRFIPLEQMGQAKSVQDDLISK